MKTTLLFLALTAIVFAQDRPPEPANPDGTTVVSVRWYRYALDLEKRLAEIVSEDRLASENERAQMLALLLKLEPVAEKAARAVAKVPPYSVTWTFPAAPAGVSAVIIQRKDMDGDSGYFTIAEIAPTATSYTDAARPLGRFTYARRHKMEDGTISAPVAFLPTAVLLAPTP
jgi:hypothetical protein